MRLFHYTSHPHLGRIVASGELRTTESNLSRSREHAGPDVVWLTMDDSVTSGHGLEGSVVDKTEVRITVEVDSRSVHKWREWAARKGIDPKWRDVLASSGGSRSWRVVEHAIPSACWVEIRDMRTGEILAGDSVGTADG